MRVCSYCHLLLADSDSVCPHDGAETRTAEVPPVPTQLHERFTSPEPYARGQTGTCYLATQQPSGYRGVLKVIPLAGVEASERVRLKRELRKQTQLAHDGLPRIIDGGELGQQLWLFREHVQGESLAQRIRRLGKLELGEALAITAQVASALDELQRNGLLHRDVKPGHIILPEGNHSAAIAKLIDAGVAARLPTGSVFGLLGTPAYISPEQVAGKLVSFRSDLYALGCVLFEMLSGQPPFPDHDVQAVLEAHKSNPPPELELDLPHQARSLLTALLAKEPRQRPFSAQQVRRTLEPVLPPGTPLPAIGTRAPARAQPVQRKAGALPAPSSPTTDILDDIDLEELSVPQADGPKTLHLSDADVDELELGEDAGLRGGAAAGATAGTVAKAVTPVAGSDEPGMVAAAAAVRDAIAHDPDATSSADSSQHSLEVIAGVGEEPASLPLAVAAGRRSVDFDVESLFSDDAPAPASEQGSASLHDAAPTQLFRPRGDEGPPAHNAASSPRPEHSSLEAVAPDPEGTVMTTRRPKKPRPVLPWVLGAAVALVLAMLIARRQVTSRSASSADARPGASAAIAPAPGSVPSPAPEKTEPSAGAAPANDATRPSQQRGAADEQPAPAPQAAASAQATDHAAPSAGAAHAESAQPPSAQRDPALPTTQPSVQPTPSSQALVQPSSGQTAKAPRPAVLPAATAAGTSTSTSTAAPDRGAELTAANAAGRSQSGTGDARLAAARGPRDDRVVKADEYKAQARDNYKAGRFREAAAAYEKATGLNPSDAGAFAGLAASRLAAGDPAAAIQAYSRAVRLQPDSSGFHAALGRAYLQKGDRDRARSAYQHALELNPNNAAAKTALAQLK